MKTSGSPDEKLMAAVLAYGKAYSISWPGLCAVVRQAGWEPNATVLVNLAGQLLDSQHPDAKAALYALASTAFAQCLKHEVLVERLRDINYLLNEEHLVDFNTLVDRVTRLEGGEVDDDDDESDE